MNVCASPTYRKRRRERILRASRAGVAARRRIMQESGPAWSVVREITVRDPRSGEVHVWTLSACEDGRSVGLCVDGTWSRAGSERTLRAVLARAMWRAGLDSPRPGEGEVA
jgi:hypothetical protein